MIPRLVTPDTDSRNRGARTAGGVVHSVVDVGPSVRLLRVGRPPGFSFRAGQYTRLGFAGGPQRKFTIASAPYEPFLEFCVERIPGGAVTPRLFAARPGDHLALGPSTKGTFVLAEGAPVHVMVATGTGIAPFRAMVRDAQHRALDGEFIVLHGSSWADGLPYVEEFSAWAAAHRNVRYLPTVSRPNETRNRGWKGGRGRVDPLALRMLDTLDPRNTQVYACGNSGMTMTLGDAARARGFRVRTEAFD